MALMTHSSMNFNLRDIRHRSKSHQNIELRRFVKQQFHRRTRREESKAIREQLETLVAEQEAMRIIQDPRKMAAFIVDGKYKRTNPTEAEVLHELNREQQMEDDYNIVTFNEMLTMERDFDTEQMRIEDYKLEEYELCEEYWP